MTDRTPAFWTPQFDITHREDGTIVMAQTEPLGPYPVSLPACLRHWASAAPARPWLAERADDGAWTYLSYAEALDTVRRIASALLEMGLTDRRPILILSGNSIDHALLALAAQYVGLPYAPVSPAYSLASRDHAKLRGIADTLRPGLIYAEDGRQFAAALSAIRRNDEAVVVSRNAPDGIPATLMDRLRAATPLAAADEAQARVTGQTTAKYLFTSGSTGAPKAVINTQGMMMANQAMVADCFRFLQDHPPVLVDWAPWNHTASGNKVFNMALYHGGTYHIDDGKPASGLIDRTIRNLREVSPTWYFNVPSGWDTLVAAFRQDRTLRESFFRRLDMMMYAGAGMAQHTWDALLELSRQTTGREVLLTSGLGSTETAPFALMCTRQYPQAGNIGVPARGLTLKLVPDGGKLEARLKGPSITPGYLNDPDTTARAFDAEGFYRLGDALRPANPDDLSEGFFFDGRVAENFKLRTGTWVAVGALRTALVNHFGGLIRDAVIVGEDHDELGALVFADEPALRALAGAVPEVPVHDLLGMTAVRDALQERLTSHAAAGTGSASRVCRLLVLSEPPDLDRGEITDKGSINQRAVIAARPEAVERLFSGAADVLRA